MPFTISKIKSSQLIARVKINSSSHAVYRCHLTEKVAQELAMDENNDVIYTKEANRIERQEESTFSHLYQMDIGESAARTKLYEDRSGDVGIASIGLNAFIEYWKLNDSNEAQKYNKTHAINIKDEVYGLDENGETKIKMVKGLANVLMSSWLYAEDDFHSGNFGLARNSQGDLIWARLDFGMSFASITNQSGRPFREVNHHFDKISRSDLCSFPDLKDASPFYWPTRLTTWNHTLNFKGMFKRSAFGNFDKKIFSKLNQNPEFIKEKHEFILKQFLIDLEQKKALIQSNIDEPRGSRLAITIESRILKLRWTALADPNFIEYVKNLSKQEQQLIFNDVANNNFAAVNLNKTLSNTFCQDAMAHLKDLINDQKNIDEIDFGKKQNYFKIIIEAENSLLALKAELDGLTNANELEKKQGEIKTAEFNLNKLYAMYLNTYAADKNQEQKLAVIHSIIDRRAVLMPINQLIIKSKADSVPPRKFFENIRKNWLTPHLISSFSLDDNADDILKTNMLVKVRNIQQMFNELANIKTSDKALLLSDLKKIHSKYEKLVSHKKESQPAVVENLQSMENELVKLKYKYTISNLSSKPSFIQNDKNGSQEFKAIDQNIKHSIDNLLPKFIDTCYEKNSSLANVEKSPFIADLKRLVSLGQEFFNKDFINQINDGSLAPNVQTKFETGLWRITKIYNKYGLSPNKAIDFTKLAPVKQQDLIQDLSFVMSRLALDLQREQAMSDLANKCYALDLDNEGSSVNLQQAITKQLIEANYQLSKAMAKPNYHDNDMVSNVAEAGLLAARALKEPTQANAHACLELAQKLSNSNQTRLMTKVAASLAVVGILCLSISLFALMGVFALPILSTLSVTALQVSAGASAITFFGSAAYAGYRFTRDKDKVERHLKKLGDATLDSIDAKVTDSKQQQVDCDDDTPNFKI